MTTYTVPTKKAGVTAEVRKNAKGVWEMVIMGMTLNLTDAEAKAELAKVLPAQEVRNMFPMVGFHA